MWTVFFYANTILFFVRFHQEMELLSLIGCWPLGLYIHLFYLFCLRNQTHGTNCWQLNIKLVCTVKKLLYVATSGGEIYWLSYIPAVILTIHQFHSTSGFLQTFGYRQGDTVGLLDGGGARYLSPKFFQCRTAHGDSAEPSECSHFVPRWQTAAQPDKSSSLQCEKFRLNPKVLIRLTPQSPVSRGRHMPKVEINYN